MSVKRSLSVVKLSRVDLRLPGWKAVTCLTSGTATVEKTALTGDFARQRQLFQIVLSKVEALADLPCLNRPGFRLLAELASDTRRGARQVDLELARAADPADPYFPKWAEIEQLIEHTSDLQDRLQRQLALAAQWQDDASELRDEVERLIGGRTQSAAQGVSFDGMRTLARRVISELLFDVTPPVLHPLLALEMLTERLENQSHARIFAVALASAQLVARVARVTWLSEDQVELVTAAALLQDCGKLVMPHRSQQEQLARKLSTTVRCHARIGATVVAGYRNAPAELAGLIASHHRRLNSVQSPFPEAVSQSTDFAHLLAAASRFERLRLELANQSTLLTLPELVDQPAMEQFWSEARTGAWDAHVVHKILVQRDGYERYLRAIDASNNRQKSDGTMVPMELEQVCA